MRRLLDLRRRDDGFALVLSLLMIMVVAGLSLGMAAVVLDQARPTLQARKTVQTVNAAQSGLQVALQSIRAASDGASNGVLSRVPCTGSSAASFTATGSSTPVTAPGSTYTGAVTAAAGTGTPTYRVSVAYYQADPTGKDTTWLQANAMSCPLASVPHYAYLQSYGGGARVTGSSLTQGNRNQVATYTFSTSNVNVRGGRLRLYGRSLCVDAGSNPAVGTALTFQACQALGTAQQTWEYRQDLSLLYGGNTTLNLCIQASASATVASLQTCTGDGTGSTYGYAPGQQVQEWGLNDNGHLAAALDDGTVTNGSTGPCLEPNHADGGTTAVAGATLVYTTCTYGTPATGEPNAFDPDPQLGAGKAGGTSGVPTGTRQYVNYAQFGRCLDISNQNVHATNLIVYPCKQAPDSNQLTFNQVWDGPAAGTYGTFSVLVPTWYGSSDSQQDPAAAGKRYCLTSPGSGSSYPITTECQPSPPAEQLWLPTGEVTGDYRASYTLVSRATGSCLTASPLDASTGNSAAATVVTAACNGSAEQKWNAPPYDANSGIGNIHEPTGG